jgi:DNA-binding CsgD family transcriptional regulator/tetratricopeptide (TPR) repeat protein
MAYEAQGNCAEARRLLEESLAIRRELGDPGRLLTQLSNLACVALSAGDLTAGEAMYEEAVDIARRFGNRRQLAFAVGGLGHAALEQKRFDEAHRLLGEAVALFREVQDLRGGAQAAVLLAQAVRRGGDWSAAAALFAEALVNTRELGDPVVATAGLESIADALNDLGQSADAARLLGAADGLRRARGVAVRPADRTELERLIGSVRAKLGPLAYDAAAAEGSRLGFAEALDAARDMLPAFEDDSSRRRQVTISSMPSTRVPSRLVHELSLREREVLALLARGLTDREIGDELSISVRTVSNHVGRILAKLDAPTRTAAVALALREGIA